MPDADALASAVALKKLIKNNSNPNELKQIDILVDADEINDVNSAIIKGVEINTPHTEIYDLAISVDCANIFRLGKYKELFENAKSTVNIDHHLTNTQFAQNNLVLKTSSCCEALYILAKLQQLKITDDICNLIYAGIITDTNNLTQGTITVETHKAITEMVERGINVAALNEHFFKNNTKSKTYLLKQALDSLTFYYNDRIAFMKLTKQDLAECDATNEDTFGIVDQGLNIKGVDIAIIAIKNEDNSYYVSLRGKGDISVAEIAQTMGGGGHAQVAAFQYNGLLADLKDQLIKECKQTLASHPTESVIDNLFVGDEDNN